MLFLMPHEAIGQPIRATARSWRLAAVKRDQFEMGPYDGDLFPGHHEVGQNRIDERRHAFPR